MGGQHGPPKGLGQHRRTPETLRAGNEVGTHSRAEDLTGDPIRSVRLHRRRHVGVNLPGDVRRRMVESIAHDLDVDALLKRQRRPCVAEAVQHEAV